MRVMFDTSVLVAGHMPTHADYESAREWLDAARKGSFKLLLAAHTLAETYSALTRMPIRPRIRPIAVTEMLEANVLPFAAMTSLMPDDYIAVLKRLAADGVLGGIVYDALGVKAAQIAHADRLLTFNLKHFRQLWPEGYDKIISPKDVAPSDLVPPQLPTENQP